MRVASALTVCLALTLVGMVCGTYAAKAVVTVTPANWDKEVAKYEGPVLVEFFAPWCGHCKSLAPEYEKAAAALKGVVKLVAVDADAHRDLAAPYGVTGFPTIKLFGVGSTPKDYSGQRTAAAIAQFVLQEASNLVQTRLGGGGGGGSNDVVDVTDADYQKKVVDSKQPVFVEFFAPWCGHCKKLAPEWAKAATKMKGKVTFAAVDATVHQQHATQLGVSGYPTIYFYPGNGADPVKYQGARTASALIEYAEEATSVPPEVFQLTGQDVLDRCLEGKLCFVAALPHILDSGADKRNTYLDTLLTAAKKTAKHGFGWVWTEGGAQPDLENALGFGFGYPALVTVNSQKLVYATQRGAFTEESINEFVRDVLRGRGALSTLSALPTAASVDAWDGKDGELPVEEEYDFSDLED